MKLTIIDRLYLQSMLPQQAGLIEIMLVQHILKMIEFSLEEIAKYELSDSEKGVVFNSAKDEEKDFEFSLSQREIIRKAASKVDIEGKVTLQMIPLVNKILNDI